MCYNINTICNKEVLARFTIKTDNNDQPERNYRGSFN